MTGGPARDDPGPADAPALALARTLAAFEEGALRARAAARHLSALPPAEAVQVVAALVRAVHRPGVRAALTAVGQALVDPGAELTYGWRAEVYAEATARGASEVAALLLAPPPRRAFEEPRDKADPRLAHLTLGHKKAMARAHRDPDLLARLAAEGEPVVVRELLRNAQLTEPFVVRIAARRPCRPETLRCIFEARRWRTRTDVALALVRNPYSETELALKLLPAVTTAALREIARDGALHPLVRAVAARIVEARAAEETGHRRPRSE